MKRYVIAVDLGGTNIKIAVIKDEKIIIKRAYLATAQYNTKEKLSKALSMRCLELMVGCGLKKPDVAGIGIGAPGLIDVTKGVIHQLVNIKGFKNVPFKKMIERETGLKTFLDNDVNVMSLGECYHGAGIGAKNVICITLGTGVGGGIIIDGRLYRGSTLSAGEIGHMPLNESGPGCNCGGHGCLERYIGNKEIAGLAVRRLKGNKTSIIGKLVSGDHTKITPEIITAAAKRNDGLAKAIWKEVAGHLAATLAGVVNLLNPERIVIGGGVSKAGAYLFGPLATAVRKRAMQVPARRAKIVPAKLGQDAGLIGAAVLVRLSQ